MRIKKPLLSTYLFAGILLVGIVVFYVLIANALDSDINSSSHSNVSKYNKIETQA